MADFLTMRKLREIFSLPPNIINYAIDKHGPEHSGRIGITRIWPREDLPKIRESLRKTGALESGAQLRRETTEGAN